MPNFATKNKLRLKKTTRQLTFRVENRICSINKKAGKIKWEKKVMVATYLITCIPSSKSTFLGTAEDLMGKCKQD